MLAQESGKIINVVALAALSAIANLAAYNTSNTAVVRLTEGTAIELKSFGVHGAVIPVYGLS